MFPGYYIKQTWICLFTYEQTTPDLVGLVLVLVVFATNFMRRSAYASDKYMACVIFVNLHVKMLILFFRKTKVFLKFGHGEQLAQELSSLDKAVNLLQSG